MMETTRETAATHCRDLARARATGLSMKRLWLALLPELRQFPSSERPAALQRAREAALDVVELAGMAVGLVVVTALTKYSVPEPSMASRFVLALINLAVAMPLLVAVLGPFHLRRVRRGLRHQLQQRGPS